MVGILRKTSQRVDASRRWLISHLYSLIFAMEDGEETMNRLGHMPLQTSIVKVGLDLNLFNILCSSRGPLTSETLAKQTGAEPLLMKRLMAYYAAIGVVSEVGQNKYAANKVTKNLDDKLAVAAISHCFMTVGPILQAIPSFLKRTGYRSPQDANATAWQDGWKTDILPFDWLADHPEEHKHFNNYMALRRDPNNSWLTVYPVAQETKGLDPSRAVFVSVGGNIGHQCKEFKEAFPDLPGRVIVQDLASTIEHAMSTPGVENMAHDFFTPQPVKGAKLYHARAVCHDWPDDKVIEILKMTKTAMVSDSVVILDEMCLPTKGVNAYATATDLIMLGAGAARERTINDWRELIEAAGLKLTRTFMYNPVSYESVIEARLV